ncbi:hypothetical protein [Helicobacter saguini]|uniref:Uncharacterized protein n=1 Tax=Helicobacter saguini TaxID=1548018 RepID=A0A6L7D620_9HELI|nr:hypothetical protein [Helicobacter saguini]MWV62001.1 hypothetical protein [Helicobacter saguini]MWV69677.1 hypothetical protein [Helicobacter saguini]
MIESLESLKLDSIFAICVESFELDSIFLESKLASFIESTWLDSIKSLEFALLKTRALLSLSLSLSLVVANARFYRIWFYKTTSI